MIRIGIDVYLDRFSQLLQLPLQLADGFGWHILIALGVNTKNRGLQVWQVGLYVWMNTVKDHARAHLRVLACSIQRERPSHAESNNTYFGSLSCFVIQQVLNGAAQIL